VYGFGTSTDGLGDISVEAIVPDCSFGNPPGGVGCGFVMQLDADSGEPLFARRFPAASYPGSVVAGADGTLLFSATNGLEWRDGGRESGAHLLAKLDVSRQRIWSAVVAEPQDFNRFLGDDWHWDRALALDPEQNVFYLSQEHDGSEPKALTLMADAHAWRIDKFSAEGQRSWQADMAHWEVGTAAGMAATELGDVVVAGHFAGTADFGSGALQAQGERDGFIVKLDAAGHPRWAQRYGGDSGDFIGAVDAGPDGAVWVAGWTGTSMAFGTTRADLPGTRVSRSASYIVKFSP
jgi:hypothetical protein